MVLYRAEDLIKQTLFISPRHSKFPLYDFTNSILCRARKMKTAISFGIFCLLLHFSSVMTSPQVKPNIVFVLADDLGWFDLSWTDPRIISPHLEALYNNSTSLENYYVHSKCTPSRAAILTGKASYSLMTQHRVIEPQEPRYIPLDVEMFPQTLQRLGYKTVAIGKWHLGFCTWGAVPTNRGFNEFYGVYLGAGHHVKHTKGTEGIVGHDWRENDKDSTADDGVYSATAFSNRAVKTIQEHDQGRPLYLYLSYLSVHTPLHVPDDILKQVRPNFPDLTDKDRRKKAAMVTHMDQGIGQVVQALKDEGMWENTIFVFSSDNGAPVQAAGFNWPYRGAKGTLFEGGTKVPAFIRGGGIGKGKFDGLFHATDWFPTLLSAATSKDDSEKRFVKSCCCADLDGVDQWEAILQGQSVREEIVYNIDETIGAGAIRDGQYKLIIGLQEEYDGHYKHFHDVSQQFTTKLSTVPEVRAFPHPDHGVMLFDLLNDPEERTDLSDSRPDLVSKLYFKLKQYEPRVVKAFERAYRVEESHPQNFNNVWSPGWCRDVHIVTAGNKLVPEN